ncbi:MAG TPA: hypothetical protein ENJ20_00945 [Bacteroidetes bacterium]|nr:hypothetical protein [Bacteroidota bacterium]
MKSIKTFKPRRRVRRRRTGSDLFFQKEGKKKTPFFEAGPARAYGSSSGLRGRGTVAKAVNFGDGQQLELRGRTNADYNNSWAVVNENSQHSSGCEGCEDRDCFDYSATVRSTFRVTTRVTLPDMAQYSQYSPCQQQRIRNAITNVLAPHEQQHVAAFETYNGTVDTPITLKGCRNQLASAVRQRAITTHEGVERTRRNNAQAASDALDPFVFNVDLDCEDRESNNGDSETER